MIEKIPIGLRHRSDRCSQQMSGRGANCISSPRKQQKWQSWVEPAGRRHSLRADSSQIVWDMSSFFVGGVMNQYCPQTLFLSSQKLLFGLLDDIHLISATVCRNCLWGTLKTLDLTPWLSRKWLLPIMTSHTSTTITGHTGLARWVFSSPRNLVFQSLHPGSLLQLPFWCPWLPWFPLTHT